MRQFIIDLENPGKAPRWLNIFGHKETRKGDYSLLRVWKNVAIISYSSSIEPPRAYAVMFNNLNSCEALADLKFESILLDESTIQDKLLKEQVEGIVLEDIALDNGSEGYVIRLNDSL